MHMFAVEDRHMSGSGAYGVIDDQEYCSFENKPKAILAPSDERKVAVGAGKLHRLVNFPSTSSRMRSRAVRAE